MSNEKLFSASRERFEQWVEKQDWFKATIGLQLSGSEYADPCINARWQGWQAEAAQPQSGEWVMVPRKATAAMIQAGHRTYLDSPVMSCFHSVWKAMLAAAPQQAAEPVAWRSKKNDDDWCYFHGSMDPRDVHDRGGTYQPLYTHPHPAQDAEGKDMYFLTGDQLAELTSGLQEHPEGYDGPCACKTCMSYASDDGDAAAMAREAGR